MGDELLIKLVKPNEHLYNKYDRDYKSVGKKKATWQWIARELGTTESECIRRWTRLRERYPKEGRRIVALANNGITTAKPWKLYEELEFLRPHIITRRRYDFESSVLLSKLNEQPTEVSNEPLIKEHEDDMEFECVTDPFQFKFSESHATEQESEQEATDTSSSTRYRKRRNTNEIDEGNTLDLSASSSICGQTNSIKRARRSQHNPAVHGFGEMIVETICGMSERKQAIAMLRVTDLVMKLKMEPEMDDV